MPDWKTILDFIVGNGGALGLAIFLIFAFMRGWIVPGFIYEAGQKRIERFIDITEATAASMDRLTDEIRSDRHAK